MLGPSQARPELEPQIHVHAEGAVTVGDLHQALWQAALQLWPDWVRHREAQTPQSLLHTAELEAMRWGAETLRPRVPEVGGREVPAARIAEVLGAPQLTLVVDCDRLDAASADATSRALEHLAGEVAAEVWWRVPAGAEELAGVVRLGGSPAAGPARIPATSETRDARTTGRSPSPSAPRPRTLRVAYTPIVGRPHPASPAELALHAAIEASPDLAGRFAYNQPVPTTAGTRPIVDLVCSDAGLAVEVDGYRYHRGRHAFAADRHRDFELSATGWRILRLTHEEVIEALPSSLNKLRAMLSAPPRPDHEDKAE